MPSRSSADWKPSRAAESWFPLVTMMRAPARGQRAERVGQERVARGCRGRRVEDVACDDHDVDVVLAHLDGERLEHTAQRIERGVAVERPPDVPVRGVQDAHALTVRAPCDIAAEAGGRFAQREARTASSGAQRIRIPAPDSDARAPQHPILATTSGCGGHSRAQVGRTLLSAPRAEVDDRDEERESDEDSDRGHAVGVGVVVHDDVRRAPAALPVDRRIEERQCDGRAHGGADPLAELADRAGDAALLDRDVAERQSLVRRHHESAADASDHHDTGHHPRDPLGGNEQGGGRKAHDAGQHADQTPHDDRTTVRADQVAADPREHRARQGEADRHHARVNRRQTHTGLQEQGRQQEQRGQRGEVRRDQQGAVAEGRDPEQREADERLLAPALVVPLPRDERAGEQDERDQQPPSARVIVGRTGREQERPHQREHRKTEQEHTEQVERRAPCASACGSSAAPTPRARSR